MAAFRDGDHVRIVRNHERGNGTPFAPAGATYDPLASGGTTTLVFDPDQRRPGRGLRQPQRHDPQLRGRAQPGRLAHVRGDDGHQRHAPVTATSSRSPPSAWPMPVPLVGMGRFSHEATATDPATGIVYETEDSGSSALYRYVPTDPANLAAGGVLQAMALDGTADTRLWGTGDERGGRLGGRRRPRLGPGRADPVAAGPGQGRGPHRARRGRVVRQRRHLRHLHQRRGRRAGAGLRLRPRGRHLHVRLRLAVIGRAQRARQRVRQPPRRSCAVRGRERPRVPARPHTRRRDLPVRREQRGAAARVPGLQGLFRATSPARSGPAPPSNPRTATGCSSTSRAPASPSPSPGPGAPAPSDAFGRRRRSASRRRPVRMHGCTSFVPV